MEHMKMESSTVTKHNIEKIEKLFPNCLKEISDTNGNIKKAIDFDILRQMLSDSLVDGNESYDFSWVGKKKAIWEANHIIRKTLRPCIEKSVNWDETKNIYIEGDNLDALKLLQESYLGKVKLIYIDPPYNTGNDFIYKDAYSVSIGEYNEQIGLFDNTENHLFRNTDSNGRFHSDWCTMIYPRLILARNLLSADGSIFISIDDNEYDNLKKICDEIFGASNFIANLVWKRKRGRDNSAKWFSKAHEYCLIYARSKEFFSTGYLDIDKETRKAYKNPDNDPRGDYRILGCWARGTQGGVRYSFTTKDGRFFSERLWLCSKEKLDKLDEENKLVIRGDNIYRKMFISENKGKKPETIWDDVSNAANASDEIKKLFSGIVFDTPKPTPYIKRIIEIATEKDSIIMDFFSGSATTANAVMTLNASDQGNRKYILIQTPEPINCDSVASKKGFKTICDIGEERIRRSANALKNETGATIDYGFRVFRVDESNMKDVYYSPADTDQSLLSTLESNIKDDRNDLDLLFACLLEWGLPLSMPYKSEKIEDCMVHTYNDGDLMACFDESISDAVVREIANRHPLRVVFRDNSFSDSPAKINVGEIFKILSPDTRVKVI